MGLLQGREHDGWKRGQAVFEDSIQIWNGATSCETSCHLKKINIPEELIKILPDHKLSVEELETMTFEEWKEFEGVIGQSIPYGCILRLRRDMKERHDMLKQFEDLKALKEEISVPLLRTTTDGAVVKLFDNQQCVGTFVFVSKDTGICAHHFVYTETGTREASLRVEGKAMKLVMSFPTYDLAVYEVEGRNGPFLSLETNSAVYDGNHIILVSYPSLDSQGQNDEEEETVFSYGRISRKTVPGNPMWMLGQYPCFPNNSGGAVVSRKGKLLGLHVESAYYEDREHKPEKAQPIILDDAISDLKWRRLKIASNNLEEHPTKTLAAFSASNVPYKQALGAFVPVNVLRMKLQEIGVLAQAPSRWTPYTSKRVRHV